jgi:hypothetical protein
MEPKRILDVGYWNGDLGYRYPKPPSFCGSAADGGDMTDKLPSVETIGMNLKYVFFPAVHNNYNASQSNLTEMGPPNCKFEVDDV